MLKMTQDLLLDSQIRIWVVFPIVLVTFLVEVLRHYLVIIFTNEEHNLTLDALQDAEMKKRVFFLQKNYKYIPKRAFEIRKAAFHPETGFLRKKSIMLPKRKLLPFPLSHKEEIVNSVKIQVCNHLPMVLAATWVSYNFSGFICTKVPIPLTLAFKSMLQRNLHIECLDPSWISSCSWYLINVFGLRCFLNIFFNHCEEQDTNCDNIFETGLSFENSRISFREDFNNLEMILYESGLDKLGFNSTSIIKNLANEKNVKRNYQ